MTTSSTDTSCLVLAYHEVAPLQASMRRSLVVSPSTFASHLLTLRLLGGQCITLEHLSLALSGTRSLPTRSFAITFDDAYVGVYRYAVPLLHRFGFGATVFVPSALLGQQAGQHDIPPVDKMDPTQLREIAAGGIDIGGHTRTHPDLPTLDDGVKQTEIGQCRIELEALLNRPVTTFAYPFGRYDRASVEAVRDAGYTLACTTQYGAVRQAQNPLTVPRIVIGDNLRLPFFLYRLWRARTGSADVGGNHD